MAVLYETGDHVEVDDAESLRFYRLAAEQGFAPAELELGRSYAAGRSGLEVDVSEADLQRQRMYNNE